MSTTDAPDATDATDATDLLTPSRFGALTLLSAKALRIYAERDLLRPHRVDPDTGYRSYHRDQVQTGWLIALLRSAELPLDQIATVLRSDPAEALAVLDRWEAALERRTVARRTVLDRVRHHLREEPTMSTITTELVPDRPVLSVLRRMRPEEMDEVIPRVVAELREAAARAGLDQAGDPFGIFHAPVDDDSTGPLEITLPVSDLTDLTGDVRSHRMPGGMMAMRHAVGADTDFPAILALYDEVSSWIDQAGLTPVGPPREIWHNSPHDPEPLDLTIAWPCAG